MEGVAASAGTTATLTLRSVRQRRNFGGQSATMTMSATQMFAQQASVNLTLLVSMEITMGLESRRGTSLSTKNWEKTFCPL